MQTPAPTQFPIAPTAIRYIKLGSGNRWFKSCRDNQRIELGHKSVPHELALRGDRSALAALHLDAGKVAGKAADYAREIADFYHLDEHCLWITFAEGCLWWAFAKPGVRVLGETEDHGERCRDLVAPWSNEDATGAVLKFADLSTRLTKVAAYRQTLCRIGDAESYLVRRINGIEEPLVAEAHAAQASALTVAERLINQLHWRDFEILCDLIFTRSGWQRVGELGGAQKDLDLILEQSTTGERAFVQVKTGTDQAVLSDYAARFDADPGFDRMFFVCHSPKGELAAQGNKPIHIWTGAATARQAIAAGLLDWLIKKAS